MVNTARKLNYVRPSDARGTSMAQSAFRASWLVSCPFVLSSVHGPNDGREILLLDRSTFAAGSGLGASFRRSAGGHDFGIRARGDEHQAETRRTFGPDVQHRAVECHG